MNKLLIAVLALILIAVPLFVFLFINYPIVLKVPAGTARVLTSKVKASVKVDGIEHSDARCFQMKSYFNGIPTDRIVLWLPVKSIYTNRAIFIIDRMRHEVGSTNTSEEAYYLLLDTFLFQSEGGSGLIPFDSAKSYEVDPKLLITENSISFILPEEYSYYGGKRIEIEL